MSAATDCPACPRCGAACGVRRPELRGGLMCAACSHEWRPTQAEYLQATRADAAWSAQCVAEMAAERAKAKARRDREWARAMYVEAGREVPAWLRGEP